MVDEATRNTLSGIPLLKTKAGPKDDPKLWIQRLKEEYQALIKVKTKKNNKNTLELQNLSISQLSLDVNYFCFSMWRRTKEQIMIGFGWSPIKKEHVGLGNAGTSRICSSTSST